MLSSPEAVSHWAAIGPETLLEVLVPLRDEHLRDHAATLVADDPGRLEQVASRLAGGGTLLVVEDPTQPSLRRHWTSPFITTADGDHVVVGWMRLGAPDLTAYVQRAVALLRRPPDQERALVLLGPRERRYAELLDEIDPMARSLPGVAPFRWSAERIRRPVVVDALRCGAATVLYTGHGNARGWFAYGGLSSDILAAGEAWRDEQASAVMWSLACRSGQPSAQSAGESEAVRPGFADHVIARGVAGVVVAPLGDPLHAENRTLAAALVTALGEGDITCRDALVAVLNQGALLDSYAVVGDPAIRAMSSPGATQRCRGVFAPAPDDDLQMRHAARAPAYPVSHHS